LVAQYLVLYENSGGDVLSDVIDSEYRNLNLSVNISSNSTTEEEKLLKRIDDYAAQHFPPQFSMTSTGMVRLMSPPAPKLFQVKSLVYPVLCWLYC